METALIDWLSLLLRWAHVMAGIMWIGTSFYFIWLDLSLKRRENGNPDIAGESWLVHGGGFYQIEKYTVAPDQLPEELHWFKYEAYLTWLTGMALMAVIYYWAADVYLIDKSRFDQSPTQAIAISVGSLAVGWLAYDLLCRSPIGRSTGQLAVALFIVIAIAAFGYTQVFSPRAAFLHIGAFIGTIMAANVFMIIIPNQKKTVAALIERHTPDPKWGLQAKQRSLHNNYLTLPVLFMMISNHYPATYGHPQSWLVALGVVLVGGLVRVFFNAYEAGKLTPSSIAAVPAAAVIVAALVAFTSMPQAVGDLGDPVAFEEVNALVTKHCTSCHAARPTNENFDKPPGNVMLEAPQDIKRHAARIRAQVSVSKVMPLGNETEFLDEDRDVIDRWVRQGAPLD